ncbi:MAG: GNAT family N-acetyltransferase [bacterium]|nr:GNAT family N-acetyltransferase [bacterium]
MEIRTFKKADLEGVLDLVKKMADYHHALDTFYKSVVDYKNWEEMAAGWLNDPEMQLFVAEDVGKIVGYIRVGAEEAPEYSSEEKIGIVYDTLVFEGSRRQGIATQLFEKAVVWFQKKKVNFIELNVDARNEGAIDFWKRSGFGTVKLRMRRKVFE